MKTIFEQGSFQSYSNVLLDESRHAIAEYSGEQTTVFISHSHADLDDLKGIIGFLQKKYNVKTYIDGQDPSMPRVISKDTAYKIREQIKQCKKFILLATNRAIESVWCNWELGYGDAYKYRKHIAIFPLRPKGSTEKDYKGSEYMSIYPYIAYYDNDKYADGSPIPSGYRVRYCDEKGKWYSDPLDSWFKQK